VSENPPEPLSFVLFAALVNRNGPVRLGVEVLRQDTMEPVFRHARLVQFTHPNQESVCGSGSSNFRYRCLATMISK
jgi:hypothetical protein